jgi:tetratricopeptide (TPR) repeat protein
VSLLADTARKATGTKSIEAYTLYLQARSMFFHAGPQADLENVALYLQEALKLDPTFAAAWAWLSRARSEEAQVGFVPNEQGWEEARRAARQALTLDPKLSEAHTAMAKIHIGYDWDWVGAQAAVRQALDLDPANWSGLTWAGILAAIVGDPNEALVFFQRAVANDPLNAQSYSNLGLLLYRAGRLSEAQVAVRKSLDLNPRELSGHWDAAMIMLASGEPAAALAEIEQENDERLRLAGRAIAYHALTRKADSDSALADLEKNFSQAAPYEIAEVHAFRNEIDQAFAWLDRAYRRRDFLCVMVKGDPLLKNLEPDPRYKALLHKMNLPDK